MGGLARLVHPFPSLLDAVVAACVAGLAGAPPSRAALLGASMLLLQLAIGAANDWADAPADARVRPSKPIPSGRVSRREAAGVAAAAAAAGLVLAAAAGPAALLVAGVGLLVGLAYDLRLKGTRWSWLPYAAGIPLLPLFGWVGAGRTVPPAFVALLGVAVIAGAALAVANALADLERDADAGVETIATALGTRAARRVGAGLQAAVVAAALGSALLLGGGGPALAIAVGGAGIVALGVGIGWRPAPRARQRAWEIQAIGLAVLAAGWMAAVASAGRLAG